MRANIKTAILSEEEFHKRIKIEEKKGLLNALFVVHGYIEAILIDLMSKNAKEKLEKQFDFINNSFLCAFQVK